MSKSCKEFAWRNARYSIELVVVRRMLEKCKVFVYVGSCKEFVRSIQRYSIELKAVRNLLEVFRGIRLS